MKKLLLSCLLFSYLVTGEELLFSLEMVNSVPTMVHCFARFHDGIESDNEFPGNFPRLCGLHSQQTCRYNIPFSKATLS